MIEMKKSKIEPYDIASLRCDGFVEYCYEYYGYRVYGPNGGWDISYPSLANKDNHSLNYIMPKSQAQDFLDFVTGNEERLKTEAGY